MTRVVFFAPLFSVKLSSSLIIARNLCLGLGYIFPEVGKLQSHFLQKQIFVGFDK